MSLCVVVRCAVAQAVRVALRAHRSLARAKTFTDRARQNVLNCFAGVPDSFKFSPGVPRFIQFFRLVSPTAILYSCTAMIKKSQFTHQSGGPMAYPRAPPTGCRRCFRRSFKRRPDPPSGLHFSRRTSSTLIYDGATSRTNNTAELTALLRAVRHEAARPASESRLYICAAF